MFFNMLKSDLRHKKSLNIILFLFITVGSVLVFISAVQIYDSKGNESSRDEYCKISDQKYLFNYLYGDVEEKKTAMDSILSQKPDVISWETADMNEIIAENLTIDGFDSASSQEMTDSWIFVCPQPKKADLVYDSSDKPFYVENGTIAVSLRFKRITGADIGDKIIITTDIGNKYQFTVSHIFKDTLYKGVYRIMLSDNDYGLIKDEFYSQDVLYSIFTKNKMTTKILNVEEECSDIWQNVIFLNKSEYDDVYVISFIVSVFLSMISIAVIVIILVTLHFTISSSIREEEKEIGMLRALGVDSLRFRMLFAMKYIAFAIVGGIIGITIGIPLSQTFLDLLSIDYMNAPVVNRIIAGTLSVVLLCAVIIIFCIIIIHSMKRISAIDALHGENHGERYGKSSVFFLHRSRRASVPIYLAVSDIFGHFRRYIFPILSYALGVLMILSAFHIRNTVISKEFLVYLGEGNMDIYFNSTSEYFVQQNMKGVSWRNSIEKCVSYLNSEGIPVSVDICSICTGSAGKSEQVEMDICYDYDDVSVFPIHGDGYYPILENEIMISYYTANKMGISQGDIVKVSLPEGEESNICEHEFVVTALFDRLELGHPTAYIGKEYHNDYSDGWVEVNCVINVPESEKPQYIRRIKELIGDDAINTPDEWARYELSEYDSVFSIIERLITVTVLFVFVLITMLYVDLFTSEDKQSVGLMRSIGISRGTVRIWQMSKIAILLIISITAAAVAASSIISYPVSQLFRMLTMTGFSFIIDPVDTYIIIPAVAFVTVMLTAWLRVRKNDDICVWDILDE